MADGGSVRLVLDEMFSPALAQALREAGHDVLAVAEVAELRAMTDAELFGWAAEARRRIVTENVKDFRPLLLLAIEAGHSHPALLLTSSRSFPRSRRNPAPLIEALCAWLVRQPNSSSLPEDWLRPAPQG